MAVLHVSGDLGVAVLEALGCHALLLCAARGAVLDTVVGLALDLRDAAALGLVV
jgi:hypothetical protein